MLDIFLNVAHEHAEKQAHSLELAEALKHLPEAELRELVQTGDIKLASNWLEQFKGTELYTKAVELEAASLEKNASIDIRVQQRLLEMKKEALSNARIDSAVMNTAAAGKLTPQRAQHAADLGQKLVNKGSNMVGSFAANGAVPKPAMPMIRQGAHLQNLASKLAAAKTAAGTTQMAARPATPAMKAYTPPGQIGNLVPGQGDHRTARAPAPRDPSNAPHREMGAAHRAHPFQPQVFAEKDPFGKAASAGWADEVGRIFARNDMEKQALSAQAITTLAGGALGLGHGLLKQDGGIVDGVLEGAGGATLGAAAHHGAVKALAHPELGPKIKDLKDKALSYVKKEAPAVAADAPKTASAFADELQKIAFGAALAGLAKAAVPAVTGFVKANPLKAGLAAVQTIGGGIQNKAQGGSFLGGAASGALGAAGTLAS